MPAPSIDPAAVKAEQRRTWDAVSTGWTTALDTFERGAARLTDRLLALGGVRPGHRVLDLATGLGEPALSAAERVGPAGSVVGVDISPAMVDVARRRARGRANVRFVVADLESVDLPEGSFDVVLSRFGLMFAVDHVAAFRTVGRLLAPGGVLAAAVWGPPPAAPLMSLGYAVLAERLQLPAPPPGAPGPFSMANPARLAANLTAAGLVDVAVEEFVVPFRFTTPEEYVDFTRAVAPPALLARIAERLMPTERDACWAAVGTAAERYRIGDGSLELPSTALTVRAARPR